jgi:hypothetical protein
MGAFSNELLLKMNEENKKPYLAAYEKYYKSIISQSQLGGTKKKIHKNKSKKSKH